MIRFALITIGIFSFAPSMVMAIEISEVAWMGSHDSANHEWIELYSPESIDITGWSISDGNNVLVELSGIVSAGQYAVLERTSDASAPGTAWQIYTGALVNTGATLTLYDDSGSVVDRVTGGDNWEIIGGDNETKATAQLSSNGWITAEPTPGQASSKVAQVVVSDTENEDEDEGDPPNSASQSRDKQNSSSAETIQLTLPDITLQLAVAAPKTTYVNQPVTFIATPSGVGDTIASSLHYTWSFGDTTTADGATVEHSYTHPGNYVVVVEAEYKRQIQRTRHQIVVLPVALTLTELDSGDLAIQNNSQTEIDIGGYRLVGNKSFTIPDYTIVLPRSQIVVKRNTLLTSPIPQLVALYDHAGDQTAMHAPTHLTAKTTVPIDDQPVVRSAVGRPTPRISAADDSVRYGFASAQAAAPEDQTNESPPTTGMALPAGTQVAAAGAATLPTNWPRYALVGVLLLGIVAVYLIPQPAKDNAPWV